MYFRSISIVTDFFLLLFVAVQFNGMVDAIDNLIYLGSGVAWLFLAHFENEYAFSKAFFSKASISLVFFIAFFCGISFFKNPFFTVVAGTLATYFRYLPIVIALFYINLNDLYRINFIIKAVFLIVFVYATMAMFFYIQNPGIARYLVSHPNEVFHGIGGNAYGLGVAVNVIAIFYLNLLLKSKKKLFLTLIMFFSILLSFSIDSATTVFTLFLCVVISFLNVFLFDRWANSAESLLFVKKFAALGALAVFVFFLRYFIADFLVFLSENIDFAGPFVIDRLQKISEWLVGGEMGDSMNARSDLRLISINAFLEHPIIGMEFYAQEIDFDVIGSHSEFFDLLGRYGLVGCVPLFMSFIYSVKKLYFGMKTDKYFPVVLYVILNALMNPMHYGQALFVFFCFVPLLMVNKHTPRFN